MCPLAWCSPGLLPLLVFWFRVIACLCVLVARQSPGLPLLVFWGWSIAWSSLLLARDSPVLLSISSPGSGDHLLVAPGCGRPTLILSFLLLTWNTCKNTLASMLSTNKLQQKYVYGGKNIWILQNYHLHTIVSECCPELVPTYCLISTVCWWCYKNLSYRVVRQHHIFSWVLANLGLNQMQQCWVVDLNQMQQCWSVVDFHRNCSQVWIFDFLSYLKLSSSQVRYWHL